MQFGEFYEDPELLEREFASLRDACKKELEVPFAISLPFNFRLVCDEFASASKLLDVSAISVFRVCVNFPPRFRIAFPRLLPVRLILRFTYSAHFRPCLVLPSQAECAANEACWRLNNAATPEDWTIDEAVRPSPSCLRRSPVFRLKPRIEFALFRVRVVFTLIGSLGRSLLGGRRASVALCWSFSPSWRVRTSALTALFDRLT